ncbi:MAG: hypothetical protein JWN65_3536 [Solirubrobacterales bacterium]|nr:hypothetical protein [Solirubrobacterales bacterium]
MSLPPRRFLADLAGRACPGLGDVMLALAAEFGASTTAAVDDDLDMRALQAMAARSPVPLALDLDLAHPTRQVLTGDAVPGPLGWRCGHQLALALLNGLAADAWLSGDLTNAERACDLRLELPIDADTRIRLQQEARRLRASRN